MGLGSSMVSTIIGFGLSAFFIAFIFTTRLLCRRLQRAVPQPMFELDPRNDVEQPQQHELAGLDPVLVAAIPTRKFIRDAVSTDDVQCSICLGEYQEKEVLRIMPICGHNFHLVCIDTWLQKQSTCPVCRLPLKNLIRTAGPGPVMVNESRPHQWCPPGTENSEASRSDGGDRPELSPPVSPQEIMSVGPETGR